MNAKKLDQPKGPRGKNVTSQDPRKPAIVAAFKRITGATKVTCLKETPEGGFQASCLKSEGGRFYNNLGDFEIEYIEVKYSKITNQEEV